MFATKLRPAFLCLVGLAFTASLATGGGNASEDRATEFVRRSMDRRFPVNVEGIILQRDPSGEGSYERVKIVRSRDGRTRHTILQPLRMAGVESVDDGETLKVHLPDKRTLVLQDSPQKMLSDADHRMRLAKRNYDFEITDRVKIADRWSVCVTATAKDDEMQNRRYYLDEATGYPLRLEILGRETRARTVFDTLAISYPTNLDPEEFQLTPLAGTKTIRYARPKAVSSKSQAKAVVGFTPIIPALLPLGFSLQEMQLNGGSEWKSVVIRLTDGLVRATVYQWRTSDRKIEAIEDSTTIDYQGIRLMIVSDLSPAVRTRILQAFTAQSSLDVTPRAVKLLSLNFPTLSCLVVTPELIQAIWTFAQIDSQAGLGDQVLNPGFPIRIQ